MSHDNEEGSKEKLIIEEYAFFVGCQRLEAVSGKYS